MKSVDERLTTKIYGLLLELQMNQIQRDIEQHSKLRIAA